MLRDVIRGECDGVWLNRGDIWFEADAIGVPLTLIEMDGWGESICSGRGGNVP